ncbi:MAG: copper resistance protein CopC [Armatimonadota bacterium]|nr:copper resistance protein CopC [Armatimonadota bacterium]
MNIALRMIAGAAVLTVVAAGTAAAHAYLRASSPAEDSTVTSVPSEVRLQFTEPVEVRFSIFKVYPVPSEPGWDRRRLNAAAGAIVSNVLRRTDDEGVRADDGLATTARTTNEVVIRLKPGLGPGAYVVMWRVLSIDTHTTQGFYVFSVARGAARGARP